MRTPHLPGERSRGHDLLTQILHYALTAVFIRGIQVLTTPILTRLLPPSEYGYSVVFQQSVNLVSWVAILGLATALSQVAMKRPEEYRDAVKTSFWFVVVLNVLLLPLLPWAAARGTRFFALPDNLLLLAAPMGFLLGCFNLFQSTLIAAKRSVEANRYTIINFTGAGLLLIVFLLAGERTWMARVESYAIIVVFLFAATLRAFLPHLRQARFRWDLLGSMLRFGVPTIFAGISYTLFTYADRMLLTRYRGSEEMGLYSFVCVIGLLPLMISASALSAFTPHLYDLLRHGDAAQVKRLARWLSLGMAGICVAVTGAARPLAMLFAGPDYHGALPAVPILTVYSFASWTMGYASVYLLFHEGTRFLSLSWVVVTALNVVLNVLFIPRYGYLAAAWTTLVAGVVHAFVVTIWIRWRYDVRHTGNAWNLGILALAVVGLLGWVTLVR